MDKETQQKQLQDLIERSQPLPTMWIARPNGGFQVTWASARHSRIRRFRSYFAARDWLTEIKDAWLEGRESVTAGEQS